MRRKGLLINGFADLHLLHNKYACFPKASFGAAKEAPKPRIVMSRECEWQTGANACIPLVIRLEWDCAMRVVQLYA
jgi:hypothetical protein